MKLDECDVFAFENIVRKRKNAKIFSFSHNVFHPFQIKFHFNFLIPIFFCHLQIYAFNLDWHKILAFPKGLINPLPNNPWFLQPWDGSLFKTLWEKEKMMVTNIFSLFYNAFYPGGNTFRFFS